MWKRNSSKRSEKINGKVVGLLFLYNFQFSNGFPLNLNNLQTRENQKIKKKMEYK